MKRLLLAVLLASAGLHTFAADFSFDFTGKGESLVLDGAAIRREALPAMTAPDLAEGDLLHVRFTSNAAYDIILNKALPSFGGAKSFSGRDESGSVFATTVQLPDSFLLEVRDIPNDRLYRAAFRGDSTIVETIDLAARPSRGCIQIEAPALEDETQSEESTPVKRTLLGAVPGNPFDDNVVAPAPYRVDIMMVFDNGAREWVEQSSKYTSITNFAIAQVTKMNQVLANTGIDEAFWYRLVDVMTVDTRMNAIDKNILPTIKESADSGIGVWGEVKTRRDACGADLVATLIKIDDAHRYAAKVTTGIGYITHGTSYNTWVNTYREWCYSASDIISVDEEYTLSHEVGHNMGLAHSPTLEGWSGPGTFDYSNGYNFWGEDSKPYHTIMAYDTDKDYTGYKEIPYFSTPNYTYQGVALGTALSNDCTRALSQTCEGIADWRATKIPLPSDVIFNPVANNAFIQPLSVSLSTLGGYEIHYTLDGSAPTRESPVYSEPIVFSNATTIKAIAIVDENTVGAIASAEYTPAIATDTYLKLTGTPSIWSTGIWTDETGNGIDKKTFNWSSAGDKTAFVLASGNVMVDKDVSLGTLVLANEEPLSLTPAYTFSASTLDVIGNATLNGTAASFENWKLHSNSSLTLAPGANETFTYNKNLALSDSSSTFVISNGTVEATVAGSQTGCFGTAALRIAKGGTLVIGGNGWKTGWGTSTPLTIETDGLMRINSTESLHRTLVLNGGIVDINCQGSGGRALDFNGLTINVNEDSQIKASNANGAIVIRGSNTPITVAENKTLSFGAKIASGNNLGLTSEGMGVVKKGLGTLKFTNEPLYTGATAINAGTLEVGFSSTSTNGTGWTVVSGATLKIDSNCKLDVPALDLTTGSKLVLPAATNVPLAVSNSVDLAGVNIALTGVTDLAYGKEYPLIVVSDGFSGISRIVSDNMPTLEDGLAWLFKQEGDVLIAKVATTEEATLPIAFVPSSENFTLEIPLDSTRLVGGGLLIAENPAKVTGLSATAMTMTLKIVVPDDDIATERTLFSWKMGDNIARCVTTNGVLDCFYNGNGHVPNKADGWSTLQPGTNTLKLAYYNYESNDVGGTWIYLNDVLAYRGETLRWKKETVSTIAIGATTSNTPEYPYEKLTVLGCAINDASANTALPNMTASGANVSYNYIVPGKPTVFGLPPAGGFMIDESIVVASYSGNYDSMSISAVASFPANAQGSIIGMLVRDTSNGYAYAIQAEYEGNGTFAIRNNGNALTYKPATEINTPASNVEVPHLYTLIYMTDGTVKLYQDGVEILSSDEYCKDKGWVAYYRVVFGCGPWHAWWGSTSYLKNPYPMPKLTVYATHIAFGTDDRSESENKVMASLNFPSEFDAMTIAEKLSYLPTHQTAKGIDIPGTLPIVDVLVAYDEGAQAYVDGKGVTLEKFAQTQIEKMNEVLITNKLDNCYSYRLAGVCKVDGVYNNIDTAPSLIAAGEGPAVSLRAARELYGADTVTLLVDVTGNTLGNSSPLNSPYNVASQHECAFSVCSIRAVDTGKQHTMIHENAHNMGCGHARAQNNINSPFEYGRGYYFKDGDVTRHTIMAYGGDNDASWYFSTSSSQFGFELGDADNDNARVLRETCGEVAKWRDGSAISLEGIEVEGITWQTSALYPWSVEGDTIRSYNQTDYTYQCTTPLKATLEGPKMLSFQHKSYFGGESVGGSNYSHFDVLLDDSPVLTQTECLNDWTESKLIIPEGTHEVTFIFSQRFAMNNPSDNKDGEPEADDAVWLKDIVLSDPEEPESADPCDTFFEWTPGSAPTGWFTEWGGEDQGGTHNVVAPDGSMQDLYVTYYDGDSNSQKWIPWESNANPESLDNYTFMVYGNIDDVNPSTGKLAVLWDMGFNGKQKTILAKDAAGNVKLIQANSNVIKRCINAGQVEGYHLFTVRFSTTSGASLQIDDGVIYSDSTFTQVSDKGFQVGSVLGGLPASFDRGTGFVVVKMLAFDTDSIPASQYRQLCEEYPAVTNRVLATVGETEYYRLQYLLDDLSSNSLTFTATDEMVVDVNGQTISAAISGEEFSLADNGLLVAATGENTYIIGRKAESAVLRISEIMPKPTDDQDPGLREGMDVNGLESGWVEVENTSDQWADLADYKFIRSNRGKKTGQADYGNFPSVLIAPHGRAIFYTSERYSNSADMSVSAWATPDEGGVKPKIYTDLGNILVWPDKVNPKKSPFVRLTYTPSNTIVDTVIIPSDVPEGYSIIVGETKTGEATQRWLCPTPTRGTANTDAGLVQIGPNVGPLYELTTGKKHDSASEFARPVPTAQPGEDYEIVFSLNPVMSPTVAGGFRDEDAIASITLVYRTDLDDTTLDSVPVSLSTDVNDTKDWGHTYKAYIPADDLPAAGHLVQWKFEITDASGNNWTSPSFNNPDDGYEWYGTIVEPDSSQMSATLPTWHMFADSESLEQMDVDASDQTLANNARVAIYDSSTSNYYDYVRIDLRGNTSAKFTKKSHGLRFAKAHPLTMTDVVTGEQIEEIRKTSLISEFADPSYMRQMMAFWLWRKMGNLVPFDFPVRCNLNGEFYQLAFNSERFTDELIEDVYGLDKFGYGYKNVGTLKSGSGTTAGGIEKKTPDDEDESNITVLQNELRAKITAAQDVSSSPDGGDKGLNNADLTKFVVQKFNLPAWLNYLASARITQEMDDVWANVCAYYDNAEMKEGVRGTGTWMPLGYDFNLSFGQWYFNDVGGTRFGLMSNQDWFKSHPLYGGNRVRCWKQSGMTETCNYGNDGFEAVWQSAKFRRLYLRRLRTLMDQELKEPGTSEADTPFMAKMREMADLMRDDAASDKTKWGNDSSDNAIDVWSTRPADMDAGINDIWNNYVVPRREHLYVTHSVTNTAKEIGYGSNLNAGIPEAQSPIADLKAGFSVENATDETMTAIDDTEKVVIMNANAEAVDMSGWRLTGRFEMTLPAGAVVDANDTITVVVDRRTYIEAHDLELTDQVIIGNAKLNSDSTTLLLNDADGTKVLQVAPPSDESLYLRLHSFDGIPPSPSDGDTDEWITLTNISETATLDLSGVRVVFLKTGDTVSKCDFTIQEGQIDPLGSVTVRQSDYAAAGWTKITNGELTIAVYDANGLVAHSGGVVQKDHKNYRGAGGPGGNFFIRLKEFDVTTFESGDFEEVAYPVTTVEVVPGEDTTLEAETQEDAEAALADCEIVLSAEDEDAGLVTNVLKLVAVQIVSVDPLTDLLTTNYVARVEIDETQVLPPAIDETPSDGEPVEIKEENPGETTVSVAISNAVTGLWYGYIVADELGSEDNFAYDIGSFERATGLKHTIKGSPRDKTQKPSGFFRVKVLPAKPTE